MNFKILSFFGLSDIKNTVIFSILRELQLIQVILLQCLIEKECNSNHEKFLRLQILSEAIPIITY